MSRKHAGILKSNVILRNFHNAMKSFQYVCVLCTDTVELQSTERALMKGRSC